MEITEEYKKNKDDHIKEKKIGIGFYTSWPFVICKDFYFDLVYENDNLEQIYLSLKEIAYKYHNKNFDLYIYKDGLFIICFKDFNYNADNPTNCHRILQYANIVQALTHITINQYFNEEELNDSFRKFISIDIQEITAFNCLKISSEDEFSTYKFCHGSLNAYQLLKRNENYLEFINNSSRYQCWYEEDFINYTKYLEDNLNSFFCKDELMQIVLIIKEAAIAARNMNFDISITLSFFAIERIINILWIELLEEKKRKKKLENDKNYTVAVKSNILYFNNKIDKDTLDKLDYARKIRNDIVHGNYSIFYDNPQAIKSSFHELMEESGKIFNINNEIISNYFNVPFSFSYSTQI